jgi:hypothetical protein
MTSGRAVTSTACHEPSFPTTSLALFFPVYQNDVQKC